MDSPHSETIPALNFVDPTFLADPYPTLDAARENGAVELDALGIQYYVTRHDDVDSVLRDRSYAVDPRKAKSGTSHALMMEGMDEDQLSILFLDDPAHGRLRGLVNKAFTPRRIEELRPRVQAIADELLDRVAEPEFDLMSAFAAPLPTIVIAEMIGVDAADHAQFKEWSDMRAQTLDPFLAPEQREAVTVAGVALDDYFKRVIGERRLNPKDDLISALIEVQNDGDRLADGELVAMLALLLAAGNVTTTDLIGNGMLALLQNPVELAKLKANQALIGNAVEEMLRFDSPVVETGRIPMTDVSIGGCPVSAGMSVAPSLASANHDPSAYSEPGRFDITRTDVHHHSFGGGAHFCLGAPLARLETQIAISTLVKRFPKIRLAEGAAVERRRLPAFRGLLSLEVRVD